MKRALCFVFLAALWPGEICLAQGNPAAPLVQGPGAAAQAGNPAGGRGGAFGGPIELGPDDKPMFPDPPAGFNVRRDNIPHGQLTDLQYDSKTLGTRRQLRVYTPPGYSAGRKYPVIYLLHGMGWNDLEWTVVRHADVVIDNLLADGKIQPMIMVFPCGDSTMTAEDIAKAGGTPWMQGGRGPAGADGQAVAEYMASRGGATAAPAPVPTPATAPGATAGAPPAGRGGGRGGMNMSPWLTPFENDLLKDIVPYIDSRYSTVADRDHRALAGLSMGGGQALNIGLVHPETFAYVGGFSSAPDTKSPPDLVPDPSVPKQLKLIWLASGNRDGLIRVGRGVHDYLKANNVPHIWHVDGNAHDTPEWQNNLYLFSQRIFQ